MAESPYTLFVGIDISAKSASVALATSRRQVAEPFDIRQTQKGFEQLKRRMLKREDCPEQILVVMEATSTYWMQLATSLYSEGFVVSVINPSQAHYFAQALLKRSKTDKIDAQTLAQLGTTLKPKPWSPPPPVYHELHQRLRQREQLARMLTQQKNRLHALERRSEVIPAVRDRMQATIDFLSRQVDELNEELSQALRHNPEWYVNAKRIMSIPGLGLISTAWILTATQNFTTCEEPGQLVSYAGLAPRSRQSGAWKGRAFIGHSGHSGLRRSLYMSAVNAIGFNPHLRQFHKRLKDGGKPGKVAICAVARKLLLISWALVAKETVYDPDYHKRLQTVPETA